MKSGAGRASARARELIAADSIPYTVQLSETVVRTSLLDYVQVFRLGGVGFEAADDQQLNGWHERLNILWRNIADPSVALWTHVVRRRDLTPAPAGSGEGFAARLHDRYRGRLAEQALMVNELYLSIVYRPAAGLAEGLLMRLLRRADAQVSAVETRDALDACDKLAQTVRASLARYEPQSLGTYLRGPVRFSAVLEFLALLLNAEFSPVPLPRGSLAHALATSRVYFGNDAIEYRGPSESRAAAVLGIKEYATPTVVGLYNRLLSAPFSFVLTQSFAFLSRAAGQGLLQRQIHRMANAGDLAVSQSAALAKALDALSSNEFAMGEHHLSLQVLTEPGVAEGARDGGRVRELNDAVAAARSLLSDTGMVVAREDLALEAAYWAQLPGNFPLRPRKAVITSRNFASMASFHNYPLGRAQGNHWGEAATVFMTRARSPFYFSLHASDPNDPDGGSRKDTGHTFICGPTGSGKTVFIGFLITMLQLRGVSQVIIDKDRGLEILVRALAGEYLPLVTGAPTGFNPLQLPSGAGQSEFLKSWLRSLVLPGSLKDLNVRQQEDLDLALAGTLALEPSRRRLSRLIEFLDPTDPEGMHARLAPWCESARGDYAWVFDNPEDTIVARLNRQSTVGIDVSEFLAAPLLRAPVTLYLFHLIRQLLDGRKLVCWMDEFWRLLSDAAFEGFAKEGPKTWRKLNGVMCMATQSASDVLGSPISRTIVEQTPTKIFFPNPEADREEYTGGFGLAEREFRLIKQLEPGSRMFLVKQGHQSVLCQLDLKGFDPELRVISGRVTELRRMQRIIAERGTDPMNWLETFMNHSAAQSGAGQVLPARSGNDE
jgi:type IV secretion system protein VirB4